MSQFFASGGQGIRVSAPTSVLPMNIQDGFPLGLPGWISLQSKGLSRVFSNTSEELTTCSVGQLCPTLCESMDCSPPGSSIHGIFQARVLEWGATAFS